jgi:hypothetical protein
MNINELTSNNYQNSEDTVKANAFSLAKHLLTLNPEQNEARLAFYHFLKNFSQPNDAVNAQLLNRFYRRALFFSHWQKNKAAMMSEAYHAAEHFASTYHFNLSFNDLLKPDSIQAIRLESQVLSKRFLQDWLETHQSRQDRFQLIDISADRIAAVIQSKDQRLRIIVQPPMVALVDGQLEPLFDDWALQYTPNLSLESREGLRHEVEISPDVTARFSVGPDGSIHGHTVSNYTFLRQNVFDGSELHRYPQLFYPIKRLEQTFIDRKSDPLYLELVSVLEKATELVDQSHSEGLKFAKAAVKRGNLALEHIFPEDRLLRLLLGTLEKSLVLRDLSRS